MTDNKETPVSCSMFIIEGTAIKYTKKGYPYFKGLFAQAGLNINNITTVVEHQKSAAACELFELEYSASYGETDQSDIFFKWFSAVSKGDFERAEKLQQKLRQKEKLQLIVSPTKSNKVK